MRANRQGSGSEYTGIAANGSAALVISFLGQAGIVEREDE